MRTGLQRITRSALVIAVSAAVIVSAAASAEAAPTSGPPLHTVTLSNSGDTVKLAKGGELRIDLKTASDGGYSWARTKNADPAIAAVLSRTTAPFAHAPGTVGYPTHTYYLLKGVGYGTTTIKIAERRSFDPSAVIARFSLTITVVPYVQTLTLADSGTHVTLKPGKSLELDLRTDTDGGYEWARTQPGNAAVVGLTSKSLKPYAHAAGTVGFPSHTYYLFKALGHGTTTIKLTERQSFDHSSIAAHFTVTITVS